MSDEYILYFVNIIIIMNRKITEVNESSLSLHQNTLIQEYHGLSSSNDSRDESSLSHDEPLSQQNITQMHILNQKSRQNHKQSQISKPKDKKSKKAKQDINFRYSRQIQNKYDFGISPSTKEQYSLLNPRSRHQNNNNHKRAQSDAIYQRYDIREQEHEEKYEGQSVPSYNQYEQAEEQDIRKENQAVLGKNRPKISYMDNFLNANPMPPKNKKGISVLNETKKDRRGQHQRGERMKEQESIRLITLPQVSSPNPGKYNQKQMVQMIKRNEQYLQKVNVDYSRRFQQSRFNFINTFMPQSLKMKNNAYNMLKYIQNKKLL